MRQCISARCSSVMLPASRAIAGFSPSNCMGTRAATPANLNAGIS